MIITPSATIQINQNTKILSVKQNGSDIINLDLKSNTYITDTTSTTATINLQGAVNYKFTQPLTSLTLSSVEDSHHNSSIIFTSGQTITVVFPNTLQVIGYPTFIPNQKYILDIQDNILSVGQIGTLS